MGDAYTMEELLAEVAAWREKAQTWVASPEAGQRLDGYRELAARCATLERLAQLNHERAVTWMERAKEAEHALRRRPWIEGDLILQGEHEADVGQVGVTIERHQRTEAENARLREALTELVQRRERACAQHGRPPDGSDGRYARARAALVGKE